MMWQPDRELLAEQLTRHFGVPLESRALAPSGSYPAFELVPRDCTPAEAFRLTVRLAWRSLDFRFEPGSFAGELVGQMGSAGPERIDLFAHLAAKCAAEKGKVVLRVNGSTCSADAPGTWPKEWRRAELGLSKSPATVNTESEAANDAELLLWTQRFAGLVFALLPLEEDLDDAVENAEGLPEGSVLRVEVNRYERSRINRAACIELHGALCKVCGFSFEDAFGPAGASFIQVHHVTPVSTIGPAYRVNPCTDLVPLCANCHAMAHRRSPPYTTDELRGLRLNARTHADHLSP
jgi:5-methylcytosine-specific restriction protein A